MLGRLCLFVLAGVLLAGCEVGASAEVTSPRLVRYGADGHVRFDALGFPVAAKAKYTEYAFAWDRDAGRLATIDATYVGFQEDHAIHAVPTYRDGLLVDIETNSVRHDRLEYNADGALIRWTHELLDAPYRDFVRSFSYDDRGRLVRVDMPGATIGGAEADVIEYVDNESCPSRIATAELGYADGRLTSVGYAPNYAAMVAYDDRGNISRFAWPDVVNELEYEDGVARGLELWPGEMIGGPTYGPVPQGGLFRLDGSCDPTLTSQPAIAAMVIPQLLW